MRTRGLVLLVLALSLAGCSVSRQSKGLLSSRSLDDPFAEDMAEVNAEFADNPATEIPTALGNYLVGGALGTPITIVFVTPFALFLPCTSEAADRIYAVSGYIGGALLGGPFVGLNWLLWKGPRALIAGSPEEPATPSDPGRDESSPP
ncbi:MAG: hypothetical protein HY720_05095 [Planctomycetes bacterium]|nr:hypothetical protein [Planctomycetota bacterium]